MNRSILAVGHVSLLLAACGGGASPGASGGTDSEAAGPRPVITFQAAEPTWTRVAGEWQSFVLAQPATVRYGADGVWMEVALPAGTHACNNTYFGRDPLVGVVKRCESIVSAPPTGAWVAVAPEWAPFVLTTPQRVRYGAQTTWLERDLPAGQAFCTNAFFGIDPLPGIVKGCEVATSAINQAPTVSLGADSSIQLPTNSKLISAVAADADGSIVRYRWSQVSGPNTAVFADTSSASRDFSSLIQGSYVFRVEVTDDQGASARDDIQITVQPAGSYAATYYVSPNGNDATGTGSQSSPWKTLCRATSTVRQANSLIKLAAGVYVETQTCDLAVGVSLEGEGTSTVVQSTLSAQWAPILRLSSDDEGTMGNQSVSSIRFDGSNRRTSWGINVRGRSNVSLHHLTMVDFEESAVYWSGRVDSLNAAPSRYATGNSFHHNTVSNSSKYDGFGRGALYLGGQDGMLIHDNDISQVGRPPGQNGWPIKAQVNDGFLRGVKIYNNKITKEAFDGITWDFAIELFNVEGVEVFNNTIVGGLDSNTQTRGAYAYSIHIHDNIIGPTALPANDENAITLEFSTDTALIENNVLRNVTRCIYMTPRPTSAITNVTIRRNLCSNVGVDNGTHQGAAVRIDEGHATFTVDGLNIHNNTFQSNPIQNPWWGLELPRASSSRNVSIKNNILLDFLAGAIVTPNGTGTIHNLAIQNNIIFGSGNENQPVFNGSAPTGLIYQNNIHADPQFVSPSDFRLKPGSPGINAGINVGLPYLGSAPDIGAYEIQ